MMNLLKTPIGVRLRYALFIPFVFAFTQGTAMQAECPQLQMQTAENKGGTTYQVNGEEVREALFHALDNATIERVEISRNADGSRTVNAILKSEGLQEEAANLTNAVYLINGQEVTKGEVDKLEASVIASVHVIQGELAMKKYGQKGKNGIVEIILK